MKNWIWPKIDDIATAKNIAHNAAGVAFFIGLVTAAIVYLQTSGRVQLFSQIGVEAYVDAAVFFVIGIGLLRKQRIAALLGLVLYVAEQYYMIQIGAGRGYLVMILFVLVFMNSVRATFAYHGFRKAEEAEAAAGTPLPKRNPFLSFLVVGVLGCAVVGMATSLLTLGRRRQMNIPLPDIKLPDVKWSTGKEPAVGGDFAPNDPSVRSFRLKTGEVIRGKVTIEDEVFYTVETFNGTQKIIIKEDLKE